MTAGTFAGRNLPDVAKSVAKSPPWGHFGFGVVKDSLQHSEK
jgi:hypothetical protein